MDLYYKKATINSASAAPLRASHNQEAEMLKFVRTAMIGSSLLLLGTGLNAQVYHDRDQYHNQSGSNVVDQVRADLNQVKNMGYMQDWQRSVLSQAGHDLSVFDHESNRGRFNRHELDQAITRIQDVASSPRLSESQRAMLRNDIGRLRDFRSTGMTYSYRTNPDNGYYRSNGYYDRDGNWHPYR